MDKLKIVFLDAATMGDVSFAPISRHGNLTLYDSSTPEQAKKMAGLSDGAIVGSAIVKLIAQYGREAVPYVADYVKRMKDAVREA